MNEVKRAAAILGSIGGSKNTLAQHEARKRNGKLGGRPKGGTKRKVKIVENSSCINQSG